MGALRDPARHRAERVHFRHAPALDHLDAVDVPEPADEGEGRGGAAADQAVEGGEVVAVRVRFEQRPHPLPDGGYPGGEGDPLGGDEAEQRLRGREPVRHHLLGAEHGGGERESPPHRMEHGHHPAHAVGGAQAHHVRHRLRHGVEVGRAVGVHHPLRVAGGAARVAEPEGGVLVELRPLDLRTEPVDEDLVVHGVGEGGLPGRERPVPRRRRSARPWEGRGRGVPGWGGGPRRRRRRDPRRG